MTTTVTSIVTNGVVVPSSPLPEGAQVEVICALPEPSRVSMLDFLETLPPGPRAVKTWEEYEQHLRQEKNAWDR
jgi:hypothetical protein